MKHIATLLLLCATLLTHAQVRNLELVPANTDTLSSWRFIADMADEGVISLSFAPYGFRPQLLDVVKAEQAYTCRFNWQGEVQQATLTLDSVAKTFLRLNDQTTLKLQSVSSPNYQALGSQLKPSVVDLRILDRTQQLLGNSSSWNASCQGYCEEAGFPFSWSLSCALQQASMDVSGKFIPHRPALQAVLEASQQFGEFKDLKEFNRNSNFDQIEQALEESRKIITNLILHGAKTYEDRSLAPGLQKLESMQGREMQGSIGQ